MNKKYAADEQFIYEFQSLQFPHTTVCDFEGHEVRGLDVSFCSSSQWAIILSFQDYSILYSLADITWMKPEEKPSSWKRIKCLGDEAWSEGWCPKSINIHLVSKSKKKNKILTVDLFYEEMACHLQN